MFNKHVDLAIEHHEVLAQLKNMESVLRENRLETIELRKERDDLKKQLLTLCEQHKQYQIRESISHAKLQDAILMVEAALAEKTAALQREKETRGKHNFMIVILILIWCRYYVITTVIFSEECDELARTIGRVMEEAGDKMEGNIGEIKSNYSHRLNRLENIIRKASDIDSNIQMLFNFNR